MRKRCVWHCCDWKTVCKIADSVNRLKAKKRKLSEVESGIRPSQCESNMHPLHLGFRKLKVNIMNLLGLKLRNVLEASIEVYMSYMSMLITEVAKHVYVNSKYCRPGKGKEKDDDPPAWVCTSTSKEEASQMEEENDAMGSRPWQWQWEYTIAPLGAYRNILSTLIT